MASDRAAELTQAYRVLSNKAGRAQCDNALEHGPSKPAAETPMTEAPPVDVTGTAPSAPSTEKREAAKGSQFFQERLSRDEFVKTATISRFRGPRTGRSWL